jgi:hypothetical protein
MEWPVASNVQRAILAMNLLVANIGGRIRASIPQNTNPAKCVQRADTLTKRGYTEVADLAPFFTEKAVLLSLVLGVLSVGTARVTRKRRSKRVLPVVQANTAHWGTNGPEVAISGQSLTTLYWGQMASGSASAALQVDGRQHLLPLKVR